MNKQAYDQEDPEDFYSGSSFISTKNPSKDNQEFDIGFEDLRDIDE